MAKRKFDDKAVWRNDNWGIDQTQPARAEKVFDPTDTVTDDPTAGGIGGGTFMSKTPVQATGVMYTGLNDDPTRMADQGYRIGDTLVAGTFASLSTNLANATNNDLVFTAKGVGIVGNGISITYVDPGGATATLGVTVSGLAITVNLGRAASAVNTTGTLLKAAVDGNTAAAALVSVANKTGNDGTGLVAALSQTFLAGGTDVHYA